MRGNVDVLMDRAPAGAEEAARAAIAALGPDVELRRLRMRQAGGRQFADVVIGVAAVGRGRPGPRGGRRGRGGGRAGAAGQRRRRPRRAAARTRPPRARPRRRGRRAGRARDPQPQPRRRRRAQRALAAPQAARRHDARRGPRRRRAARGRDPRGRAGGRRRPDPPRAADRAAGGRGGRGRRRRRSSGSFARRPGRAPRELRFLRTDAGLVAFLTLGLDGGTSLDDAHARASEIEERIRVEAPEIADVVVHTEPCPDEALHVQPEGARARARLARADRRRPDRPARRADAAGVLHRRRRRRASTPSTALADCDLLAPVLYPPAVRVFTPFERAETPFFSFRSPHPVLGPEAELPYPEGVEELDYGLGARGDDRRRRRDRRVHARERLDGARPRARRARGRVRARRRAATSRSRSARSLVTPDELAETGLVARVNGEERCGADLASSCIRWPELVAAAARNTALRPGDLLVAPASTAVHGPPLEPGRRRRARGRGDRRAAQPASGQLRDALLA